MNIEGPIGVGGPQPVRGPKVDRTTEPERAPELSPKDTVEVSLEAKLMHLISQIPDIRADKVSQARQQIEQGDYETEEKLDTAIKRLIVDLDQMHPF